MEPSNQGKIRDIEEDVLWIIVNVRGGSSVDEISRLHHIIECTVTCSKVSYGV